jgi:hypothetical protein
MFGWNNPVIKSLVLNALGLVSIFTFDLILMPLWHRKASPSSIVSTSSIYQIIWVLPVMGGALYFNVGVSPIVECLILSYDRGYGVLRSPKSYILWSMGGNMQQRWRGKHLPPRVNLILSPCQDCRFICQSGHIYYNINVNIILTVLYSGHRGSPVILSGLLAWFVSTSRATVSMLTLDKAIIVLSMFECYIRGCLTQR